MTPAPESGAGLAATIAVANGTATSTNTMRRSAPRRALAAMAYVVRHWRRRFHAESQRRRLRDERDGIEHMLRAAWIELGNAIAKERPNATELEQPLARLAAAERRRAQAQADLASAESLQASEDLRLGKAEAHATREWEKCQGGLSDVETALRELARTPASDAGGGTASPGAAGGPSPTADHDEAATLRERAAALKAAASAARARLDDATAARRRATAAMRATLTGHARGRAEAEEELTAAGVALGQAALRARPDVPSLKPRYARLDRLRESADLCTRKIAEIETAKSNYDPRRLLSGTALWLGALAASAVATWALLRR